MEDSHPPREDAPALATADDAGNGASSSAHTIRLLLLIGLGIGAGYVIAILLWPFLPAIVTSAVLAALFHPLQRRIRERLRNPSVAAFTGTTIVFFLVLLPLVALSFVLVNEIVSGIQWVARSASGWFAPQGRFANWLEITAERLGIDAARVGEAFSQQIEQLAAGIATHTLGILSGLGGWLIQAGIALFTLYYLLRDGHKVVHALKWLFPLRAEDTDHLVGRALEVTYATVYGNVAVAMAQGALGGIAFAVLGLPSAALWGTVMAVLSLLPAIGAFLVWMPAGVILILSGQIVHGVALFAFGALVISTIDNLLRAILVSGRAQLHPLVVFFSVLGGLVVFGATGIFIGPVLFVLSLTLVEMARIAIEPDPDARATLRASMPLTAGPPVRRRWLKYGGMKS